MGLPVRLLISNLKEPAASFERRRFLADLDSFSGGDESEGEAVDVEELSEDESLFERLRFLLSASSDDEVDESDEGDG